GQFYRQFALTIVSATAISAYLSLTLSPALAALVLKPSPKETVAGGGWRSALRAFPRRFNAGFGWLSARYGKLTALAIRALGVVGIAYVVLIVLAGWRFWETPTGFIPAQDQGYLIGVIQMPPGSSLQRTDEVLRQAQNVALGHAATQLSVSFAGLDGATFTTAPNAAAMFVVLKPQE